MSEKQDFSVPTEESALKSLLLSLEKNSDKTDENNGNGRAEDSSSVDKDETQPAKKPRKKWKKPKGKPKRPLSAYNLYFKAERQRMLKRRVKQRLGFRDMAKIIGSKWHNLTPKSRVTYERSAEKERAKYFVALAAWRKRERQNSLQELMNAEESSFDRQIESCFDAPLEMDVSSAEDLQEQHDQPRLPTANKAPISTSLMKDVLPSSLSSSLDTMPLTLNHTRNNSCSSEFLATTLRIASDLSNDFLQSMDSECIGRDTFALPTSKNQGSCHHSPSMERILDGLQGLESTLDDEFIDFMSTLDFNGKPVHEGQH